jgi:hypothetical protein
MNDNTNRFAIGYMFLKYYPLVTFSAPTLVSTISESLNQNNRQQHITS